MNGKVTTGTQRSQRSGRRARVVAMAVFVVLVLVWGGISIWQRNYLLDSKREQVNNEIVPYSNALSSAVDRRLMVLEAVTTVTQAHMYNFAEEHTEFEIVSSGFYATVDGIRSILIAPDGVVRFLYPPYDANIYGNMAILDQDLVENQQWGIGAEVEHAIETGELTLSNLYHVQQLEDPLLIGLEAITDEESGDFWGLVVVAMEMQPILDEAGLTLDGMDLAVALKDDSGQVFYGQPGLFESDPVVMTITLPGGRSWQLAGKPVGGWQHSIQDALLGFQVGGLIIVGLITTLVYVLYNRQANLAALVQERTEEVTSINQSLRENIAERVQREEELRESREQYEGLFASMRDGYALHEIICDDDGKPIDYRYLDVNPAWERYTGLRRSEVIGKTALEVMPGTEAHWIETFGKVALTGEAALFENYFGDLKNRWFECVAFRPKENQFAVTFLEVTERKKAEMERLDLLAQVQEQAERVQHIIDTVPEGVMLINSKKQVALANPLATRDLKVLAQAELGDTLTHLGNRPIDELLTSPPMGFWHDVDTDDSIARHFEVIARPIETGPENAGWVLVFRDVTREREVQTRVQLQERLAAVGQLAAGIAHDFNNIMATIILRIELILKKMNATPKEQEYLLTIREQALRASNLINQILDFSRQSVIERQPLDLVPFLKEQVQLFERTLPENIKIRLGYDQTKYTVLADLTRMQQIVMNLVVNARDVMPDGGELNIVLDRVEFDQTTPSGVETGEWVQLNITDTGTGIPEETLPHIFEPFYTTKSPGEGTGLGLAQVYGIVKQHGGHIDVHTIINDGTTFTIYFPCVATDPTEKDAQFLEALTQGHGETILVVEDHQPTRAAVVDSLIMLNYQVLTAVNGQEALEVWRDHKHKIVLVLSDVVMPKLGGIALFHALKQDAQPPKMVLLSGHPLENEMETLREQGLQDWLMKPIDLEKMAQVLARALTTDHSGPDYAGTAS